MKKTILALSAVAAIVGAAPASAATNLLVNGSFEANGGSLDGWSVSGGNGGVPNNQGADPIRIITYGTNVAPYGENIPASNVASLSPDAVGTHAAYFVADGANQFLSQAVTLEAGLYLAGFDYFKPANGSRNPNNATLTATLNGTAFAAAINAAATPVATWLNAAGQQFFDVKTTGTYTFGFSSGQFTAKDLVVDRAYLIAAVPEPATWAMMLLGFGMVGAAARYRRRASNVRFA